MTDDDQHARANPTKQKSPDGWTRDQKLAVIGIIVAIAIGVVTILVSDNTGDTEREAGRSSTKAASTSTAHSTPAQPPAPSLSPSATCASVRETATGETGPHRTFIDSPGQIGGGPRTMEGRLLSNKQWTAWLHVKAGEEVELSVKLHDPDYGSVEDVKIATRIVEHIDGCWRLGGAVRYATDNGRPTMLGPLLIQVQTGQHATRVAYVPRTTRLLDEHDKELAKLPDGVLSAETTLPYSVPPGAVDVYFVNFRLKIS